MTRAKFYVDSKKEIRWGNGTDVGYQVELKPVMSGSKENEEFYRLSPGGSIQLTTINKTAADGLVTGKEYYVDFTDATPVVEEPKVQEA